MGSLSIWHWLIVLLLVLIVFGSRKLRGLGADLGVAIRGFRDASRGVKDAASEARTEITPSLPRSKLETNTREKTDA